MVLELAVGFGTETGSYLIGRYAGIYSLTKQLFSLFDPEKKI